MLSAIAHQMRRSQVLPGYPHSCRRLWPPFPIGKGGHTIYGMYILLLCTCYILLAHTHVPHVTHIQTLATETLEICCLHALQQKRVKQQMIVQNQKIQRALLPQNQVNHQITGPYLRCRIYWPKQEILLFFIYCIHWFPATQSMENTDTNHHITSTCLVEWGTSKPCAILAWLISFI